MGKEIIFKMSKSIYEMASKPIRTKREAILLLLNTMRMFDVNDFMPDNQKASVVLSVDKMNRIFYILENKIFSMQFPFCVELENESVTRIYDRKAGLDIDFMLVSVLIGLFTGNKEDKLSLDEFVDEILLSEKNLQNASIEQLWELVKFVATFDLGYLRYDYDEEHANGLLHPTCHLDVFLETAATYKVGLEEKVDFRVFKDILDVTTDCYFLKSKK